MTILNFDRRARTMAPAVEERDHYPRGFNNLLADSLRRACQKDGGVIFSLMARVLEQHLLQTTQQPSPITHSDMNTSLDEILMMVSLELHDEMECNRRKIG